MTVQPELITVDGTTTAVLREVVPMTGLAGFYDRAFTVLPAAVAAQGAAIRGPASGSTTACRARPWTSRRGSRPIGPCVPRAT